MSATNTSLCKLCSQLNLEKLLEQPPSETHGQAMKDCEEARAVWLPETNTISRLQRKDCALCKLIAECAARAHLWKSDATFRCRITPVYAWGRKDVTEANGKRAIAPQMRHTGKWHVWFYEVKMERKLAPPQDLAVFPVNERREPDFADYGDEGRTASQDKLHTNSSYAASRMALVFRSRNNASKPSTSSSSQKAPPTPKEISSYLRSFKRAMAKSRGGDENSDDDADDAIFESKPVDSAIASWTFEAVVTGFQLNTGWTSSRRRISCTLDTALLRKWLSHCHERHDHPGPSDVARTRLKNAFSAGQIRAISTQSGQIHPLPPDAKYVALSYVWGGGGPPAKTNRTSDYPRTIQDALEVTGQLGYEWLWVDRLCIHQDDEAEKALLVPVIKDIFALAELTIVAATKNGAHSNLPGTLHHPRKEEELFRLHLKSGTVDVLSTPRSFNALLQGSAWRTRGWTFEENVFSRRLLYFFDSEVMFSCSHGTFRESNGERYTSGSAGSTWSDGGATPPTISGLLHSKFNDAAPSALTTAEFVRAVEEYTSRNLTYEDDRIKAFAGLVTASSGSSNPVEDQPLLLHGHPLQFFETALTWHVNREHDEMQPITCEPFAPSWSWASAGGKIQFLDNGDEHTKCSWFKYMLFEGYDVLGIPSDVEIPIVSDLGLQSPVDLITTLLEKESLSTLPPEYSEVLQQTSFIARSRLPCLQLVTVVFTAWFLFSPGGSHTLRKATDQTDSFLQVRGYWSYSGPSTSERKKFAIVGGNAQMYIMALKPNRRADEYSRQGLYKLGMGPFGAAAMPSTRAMLAIMKAGNAEWVSIKIV